MIKQCAKCSEIKSFNKFRSYFSNDRGKIRIRNWCKKCEYEANKIRLKIYRKSKKYIAYTKTDHFKELQRRWNKNRTVKRRIWDKKRSKTVKCKLWRKFYESTPQAIERRRISHKKYRTNHPTKFYAHRAIIRAVNHGKIKRPIICSKCSQPGKIEAHHFLGYAKKNWFNIQWLCRQCHVNSHHSLR